MNDVTWEVYVGESGGQGGRVTIRKLGEYDSKRLAARAVEGARGGNHAPILKRGHTYFTIPPKR